MQSRFFFQYHYPRNSTSLKTEDMKDQAQKHVKGIFAATLTGWKS